MTPFLIGAALLLATALLFVLPPLLRPPAGERARLQRDELNLAVLRDQLRELEADLAEELIEPRAYESAKRELELRVAEEVRVDAGAPAAQAGKRWTVLAVAVAVPVIAISLYWYLGTPAALDPTQVAAQADGDNAHAVTPEQMEGMVAGLAEKLKNRPDDVEGWNMLARSYNALGRFPEASKAYEHLVKLVPNDANLLSDYADTLAMAMNRTLQGEPERIVDRALSIDPNNVKALALSGSAAFERGDYAKAAAQWQRILALVPADSDAARSTQGSIAEAQRMMGQARPGEQAVAQVQPAAPAAAEQTSKQPQTAAGGATVEGIVDLDPALRSQVADTDAVFIFARAAQGPRFPLAVLRKQVKDLPVKFTLDDSMSMMPTAKLSDFPTVVVGARISKSGSATPSAGDLEGMAQPVAPGTKGIRIKIDSRHQ